MVMGTAVARKWVSALFFVVVLVFAVGCQKRQTVKSTEAVPDAVPPAAVEEAFVAPETIDSEAFAEPESVQVARIDGDDAAGVAATEVGRSIFQDIRFDFDKVLIREDARVILAEVAAYLKRNDDASLLIEGHADERGTSEYNMALGERRAESARSYLVSLGIGRNRLSTVSYGFEKPADPRSNEEAWARNRRAHFVLK
jgi:peptidoglycan-associated lipoprotein